MKVAHLLWAPKIGGAELFALRLAFEQAKSLDVTLLYLGTTDSEIQGRWAEAGKFKAFGCRHGIDIRGFARLIRHLKANKYDVIHQHQSPSALPFIRFGAPSSLIVKHEHGRSSLASRSKRQRVTGSLVTRFVDIYVANSDYTADQIIADEGVPRHKTVIVRGGVDLEGFQQAQPGMLRPQLGLTNSPLVLFLGRLVWEKGIDDFLSVAEKVHAVQPDCRFLVVGDGPLRKEIESDIKRRNLSEVVVLLGMRSDVATIMRNCNVFLMTSRQEAQGLTVLEAMAADLPVISFDAGGLPEVVGEAGVLIRDRSTAEMAASVEKVLLDPILAESMQRKGREQVERFSYPEVASKLVQIYQESLKP
ncbi:MAG: glycosyltransferase family 4 protein [Pseudomonadota bacterium]